MRVAVLSYRSNPYSGGQGVYVHYLSRGLRDLGHKVTVISGPPYPELHDGIQLIRLPSLDLYSSDGLRSFRWRKLRRPEDVYEYLATKAGLFAEPFTFGLRAYRHLRLHPEFDILHDNQTLSFGLLALKRRGFPVVATIHHPIHLDRDYALASVSSRRERWRIRRWYSFLHMQGFVARRLRMIISVSESSRREAQRAFAVPPDRFRTVPIGVDADTFQPLDGAVRHPHRLLVVSSADMPIKGLEHLFGVIERLACERPIEVVIVGGPSDEEKTEAELRRRRIADQVHFLGRIPANELVRQYATATATVVPSFYEGFGLPAAEAMACETPVVAYEAGALPEVIGPDGVAGRLVPPYDQQAMARAIGEILDDAETAARIGAAGRERVKQHFTWERTVRQTAALYEEALALHQEEQAC